MFAKKENKDSLETRINNVNKLQTDPFWDNLDILNTFIIDSNLPIAAYTPSRIVDLAKAYRELEIQPENSNEYCKSMEIINKFKQNIDDINTEISNYKFQDKEKILKELEATRQYMNSLQEKAITLSRRIGNVYNDLKKELDYETTRWKKKTSKIEQDKNTAINMAKIKKSIIKNSMNEAVRLLAATVAAVAAYNIPGKLYVKLGAAAITALVTYLPLDMYLDYREINKINDISKKFDPLFEKADEIHQINMRNIEMKYKKRLNDIYIRAVADTVREAARYFPDAVVFAKKSKNSADINKEIKLLKENLENTLNS